MYHLRRPSSADLASLASQQSAEAVSYDDVGCSLHASSVPGYHRLRAQRPLGTDASLFLTARRAIEDWVGHRHARAVLRPERPALEPGVSVVLALRVGPLWATAACRIVQVVDEANRFGFAYGTLPHHPAQGEEAFLVVRDPATGQIHLEISACSRPRSILTRLGGPVGRQFQELMARRYLDGFEAAVRRSDAAPDDGR